MTFKAHAEPMNLIALPIAHEATLRAVAGAHRDDRRPRPRTRRR